MGRKGKPDTGGSVEALVVGRREGGLRLDLFLVGALEGVSRKQAKRLVDSRRVSVDGRLEPMASRLLRAGEHVRVLRPSAVPEARASALDVLFRDEHCLAVDKPAGIPSGPTRDPGRVHAALLAERALGAPLTLLHRLDKDTSGVLLLGRSREFSRALLEDFRQRRVEKVYLALVQGTPRERFEVVSHLKEAAGDRILTVRSGGVRAETAFRVLARAKGYALVEARPRTGRTHQIRVHLAGEGCPIVGDARYGGCAEVGGRPVPRQMLHARTVCFRDPASGVEVRVEAPLPEDFLAAARAAFGPSLPAAFGVGRRRR